MIKAVIFDLDQTLVNRTATFKGFLENQFKRFQNKLAPLSAEEYVSTILRYDNNGYTSKDEVYNRICDEWQLSISTELLADFLENYGYVPILFDDSKAVLETLSQQYPLGLITNGRTHGQNAKIDSAGIRHFFKTIKISETEEIKKPHRAIFERCLDSLGISAAEAVYIGDHPEKDVAAAKRVGLKGVWVANPHFSPPNDADGIINNLQELIELIPNL